MCLAPRWSGRGGTGDTECGNCAPRRVQVDTRVASAGLAATDAASRAAPASHGFGSPIAFVRGAWRPSAVDPGAFTQATHFRSRRRLCGGGGRAPRVLHRRRWQDDGRCRLGYAPRPKGGQASPGSAVCIGWRRRAHPLHSPHDRLLGWGGGRRAFADRVGELWVGGVGCRGPAAGPGPAGWRARLGRWRLLPPKLGLERWGVSGEGGPSGTPLVRLCPRSEAGPWRFRARAGIGEPSVPSGRYPCRGEWCKKGGAALYS